MRRILVLALLAPGLAFGQQAVKLYTTDTVQSSCSLAAANDTCQVAMAGKTSVGFIVTGNTSPTGMVMVAEESRDGTNWTLVPFADDTENDCSWTVTNTQLATTGFQRSISLGSGVRYARVRLTARTTNATTVAVTATDTPGRICKTPGAAFATSGVSTATTLTEIVAVPTQVDSKDLAIYVTSVTGSASAAGGTAADAHFTLKYGTGTNCGTGTTTLSALALNVVNGGFVISLPADNYIKVPAGKALCWIHSTAGTKILSLTYFLAY